MAKYDLPREYADRLSGALNVSTQSVYDPEALGRLIGPQLRAMRTAAEAIEEIGDTVPALAPNRDGYRPDPEAALRILANLLGEAKAEADAATRRANAATIDRAEAIAQSADYAAQAAHHRTRAERLHTALRRLSSAYRALLATI